MLTDSFPAATFVRHRRMQHTLHPPIEKSRAPFGKLKLGILQAPRLLPLPAALAGCSPRELLERAGVLALGSAAAADAASCSRLGPVLEAR